MKKPLILSLRPRLPARPFRLWMTGSLAVVMAAMIPLRDLGPNERAGLRTLRHSRYSVNETVRRIETAALERGLTVLALMRGAQPVLVLASSVGGTPVVMQHADSQPAMPLSVLVRASSGGGADVFLVDSHGAIDEPAADAGIDAIDRHRAGRWAELPQAVTDDLDALPGLVARAIA